MKTILAFIAAVLVMAAGCTQQGPIVGNDTDSHGCKISAGYSWCEEKGKCLRPFEENCTVACTADAKICPDGSAVGRVGPDCEFAPCPQSGGNDTNPMVGNDTDEHGCKGSAGYSWCEILKKCIRSWETPCEVPQYTVKTANTSLGEILVGGDGFALYTFDDDSENNTTCYGTCAANWPPLLVTDTIAIPKGLPGTMGAILRSDNTTQVTYDGMPLYTYYLDFSPGDVKGDGVGGKWHAVKVD